MFQSIVVGTDGSETASKAVSRAAELARSTGAQLHLVTAYKPLTGVKLEEGGPETRDWRITPDMNVEAILADALAPLRAGGVNAETHARQGDPAAAIIEVAEDGRADLIVVGNKGMTGAKRYLLGSVPNKVSHHAPCSVMIVRTT
jgi:nucleotide-binding universal stress UspA family protein